MTDRPIIFSTPMVRALLEGRKTQTRRVLKPPLRGAWIEDGAIWAMTPDGPDGLPLPYARGDRLWVREGFCWVSAWGWRYRADNDDLDDKREFGEVGKWQSPIHMPRWASRLTLTVTDVRVQRLHDISEADAVAEGIEPKWHAYTGYGKQADVWMSPYDSFASLWISIHNTGAWDANPWVVALTFTVEKRNIDTGDTP